MVQIKYSQNRKKSSLKQKNSLESLKDSGSSVAPASIIDQLFGKYQENIPGELDQNIQPEKKQTPAQRKEFSIFSYNNYYETEVIKRQIKELTEQVKKEISFIKKADTALASDLKDIERISLESLPAKPGIYHIRFLEIILRILKSLREKIGESRTWLSALVSRKKKRGSLFAVLSKKKGTQYSLSQELTSARSIQ